MFYHTKMRYIVVEQYKYFLCFIWRYCWVARQIVVEKLAWLWAGSIPGRHTLTLSSPQNILSQVTSTYKMRVSQAKLIRGLTHRTGLQADMVWFILPWSSSMADELVYKVVLYDCILSGVNHPFMETKIGAGIRYCIHDFCGMWLLIHVTTLKMVYLKLLLKWGRG